MRTSYQNWREYRRYRALALFRAGEKKAQIARILGVSSGAVTQWLQAVERDGEQALQSRKSSGRPVDLAAHQLAELPALLDQGAQAHGFEGAYWTRQRVAWLVEDCYQVSYSEQHIGRLLRQLDYTLQKPAKRHYRQKEEDLRLWRKNRLVAEKKSP